MNQDPLEGLFSIIRSIGGLYDHPTALRFKYRLRNYIMRRNDEIISESSNVMPDDVTVPNSIATTSSMHILNSDVERDNAELVTGNMFSNLVIPENDHVEDIIEEVELSELQYDGLENLAGFVAFKFKKENLGYIPDDNDVLFSWVNHLSEGGLMKPTEDFLMKCIEMESIFVKINGDDLIICNGFIQNLLKHSEHIQNISREAKSLFFRCKMFFRIRILNNNSKKNQMYGKESS